MMDAVRLGEAARGRTAPNPNVGCIIVNDGKIVGLGATGDGGRPHAEAVALAEAGKRARGATLYTTLEPCAHSSKRGPTCAAIIPKAGISRVVVALKDPDPRTAGQGIKMLRKAGIEVKIGIARDAARESISGYLSRIERSRPRITLKLALSIDGKIALPSGESKWITGEDARAHVHLERAHSDMILVGRGTYLANSPSLDVRLPGLEDNSPRRALLTRGSAVDGWEILSSRKMSIGFMTSTICSSRAGRPLQPPSWPRTWLTAFSSIAPRSWSARESRASVISAWTPLPMPMAAGARPTAPTLASTASKSTSASAKGISVCSLA